MLMYGCIGMKYTAEICHTEDLCPKQRLIEITCSVATSVLYKLFITFYSATTNEGAKANCVCHTSTERSTGSNAGNRNEDFPNPCEACLLFCCHGQALQSDGHVPQALLKRCHQVSLKSNHTGGVGLLSSPKKEYFCRCFNQSTQCMALFVV